MTNKIEDEKAKRKRYAYNKEWARRKRANGGKKPDMSDWTYQDTETAGADAPTDAAVKKAKAEATVVEGLELVDPNEVVNAKTDIDNPNKDFVPETDGNYVARTSLASKDNPAIKNDVDQLKVAYALKDNTLLKGETGTGKTHAVRHVCNELGLAYCRVNANEGTTKEELIGHVVPTEGDKHFKWVDGVLTRFVKYGGVFVLDEFNMASPGILALLNPLLDDERRLVLTSKDGSHESVIHAHKDFWFVATCNEDYEGTKPMNAALKDRFKNVMEYEYDDKVEAKLIKDNDILKVAEKLREMYRKQEILSPTSTRTLLQYVDNCKHYGKDIAIRTFLAKFGKEDAKAIESVLELTLKGRKTAAANTGDSNE